jgi:hypothetical protein
MPQPNEMQTGHISEMVWDNMGISPPFLYVPCPPTPKQGALLPPTPLGARYAWGCGYGKLLLLSPHLPALTCELFARTLHGCQGTQQVEVLLTHYCLHSDSCGATSALQWGTAGSCYMQLQW